MSTIAALTTSPSVGTSMPPRAEKRSPILILETLCQKEQPYSQRELSAASEEVNRREYMAFGRLGGDATWAGLAKFAKAYIAYVNQLTPEEQSTQRYAGTVESITVILNAAEAHLQNGEDTHPADQPAKDALTVFMEAYQSRMKAIEERRESSSVQQGGGDKVSLSAAAQHWDSASSAAMRPPANAVARYYGLS